MVRNKVVSYAGSTVRRSKKRAQKTCYVFSSLSSMIVVKVGVKIPVPM